MQERIRRKHISKLGNKMLSVLLSVSVVVGGFSAMAGNFTYAMDAQAIPESGLIVEYSFAEAPSDGKTVINNVYAPGAVGNAVVQNEATASWEDNSLVFSGEGTSVSNPAGTWVSLPNNILSGKTSATISIEVKPSAAIIDKYHFLWSIGNAGTNTYWFANLRDPRTTIKYGGSEKSAASAEKLAGDRWYSVTSVINAENKTITYYIDGVKVGEKVDDGMSLVQLFDQSRNTIGRAPYNDPLFEGAVSTFRVYDRALIDEEIKAISTVDAKLHEGPAAPSGLTLNHATVSPSGESGAVSLEWGQEESAANYIVYRKMAGEQAFTALQKVNETSYIDVTIAPSTEYEYRVTAVNSREVESSPSVSISAQAEYPTNPPSAPSELSITRVMADNISMRWTSWELEGGAIYGIYRSNTADGTYEIVGQSNTTVYIDSEADTSTSYYYQVRARNYAGESSASNTVHSSAYVPPQPLPDQFPLHLDFGQGVVAEGYFGVKEPVLYSEQLGYGFDATDKVALGDDETSDPLKSDYLMPQATDFKIDLPNGDYKVTVTAGDANEATETAVTVEGMVTTKIALTAKLASEYLEQSFEIALVDGQLNFSFSGASPKINGIVITKLSERTASQAPTVYIAGDSTVQTYDPYWKPEAGWGQMIPRYFSSDIQFSNQSIGGRSSKSFILEGRLDNILRSIKPDDYLLVQFGHNDASIGNPERYASPSDFKEYLKTYIEGARQRGAEPVLITPVGRRDYNPETGIFNISFPEYVNAMKEVAGETNTKLVDLSTLSREFYNSIGPEGTLSVFLHTSPGVYGAFPNGSADNTHFQEYGAIQIARLLSGGIEELEIPLSSYVADVALPAEVPAKPTGVVASSVSNSGAVLNWNAVQGADIYKIYNKLTEASEYVLVGTATVPTMILQGMAEGQSYDLIVTAVNGRGDSEQSDVVTITTKQALFKFDFGPAGSPLMMGYHEVNETVLYTEGLGYGITDSTGMYSRDRGWAIADPSTIPLFDMNRDWIASGSWQFNVDLQNGLYSVRIYSGDYTGAVGSTLIIEDVDFGGIRANKGIADRTIPQVIVSDGQMTFNFDGSINGIEITPILMAPTGLKVDQINADPNQPFVSLSWTGVEDTYKYNVYRKIEGAAKFVLIGSTSGTEYVDNSADLGLEYLYQVTAADIANAETGPTDPVAVSMVDPEVAIPDAPLNLSVEEVNKNDLTIKWDESVGAIVYYIYRAEKADGDFELIDRTREMSYTDTTVLTTIPYYYKIAAVSAGGISELSETLATPAETVLYRQAEYLDRALVAVKQEGGVYVGWRMLGTDPSNIAFNLYRNGVKVNAVPITGATNLFDEEGTEASVYQLKTLNSNGVEKKVDKEITVLQQNYWTVPLDKPEGGITPSGEAYVYNANDTSVGDLDGDGTYELVVKWASSLGKDNSHSGYSGNDYIDAYKLDGTRIWRINLGKNIRSGAHYTQFMVYDLDGDGKAEVTMKTADGTVDGTGAVIGNPLADHRNSGGYILLGPEYLTVFDGETGKALSTVDYVPQRGNVADWGDAYGNRVDRYLASVAYLDGEHPSLIFSRGYYAKTVIAAFDYKDGALVNRWVFDSTEHGKKYEAQGNHNMSIGDVDGDGKDEITFGAMAIDDDGTPIYSTELGHGDAMHLSDLDPSRPGLEVFDVHEHADEPYGMEFRDAETGEIIWGVFTGIDTGRGLSADIDPRYLGAESWAATILNAQNEPVTGLYTTKGELITTNIPSSTNFAIWWDGDLSRELLNHSWIPEKAAGTGVIEKWDYENETTVNLLTAVGTLSNNHTKGTPNLQADLFGDWREEAVWRTEDSSELRIYTTTDVTDQRIYTLMHDPIYRLGVAWQNSGYNQPPHTGFYLGTDMEEPPTPRITIVNEPSDFSAPKEVAAVAGNKKVVLSWNAVEGATEYQILRSDTENGEFAVVGTSSADSYTDTNVVNGRTYYYRIVALNEIGESDASKTVNATPSPGSSGNGGGSTPGNGQSDDGTIVINDPSPGSSGNGGGSTPGNGQSDDGTIVVNDPQAEQGKVTVSIAKGKNQVLIPAHAKAVNGNNKLSLEAEDITVEIPAEVLDTLKGLVTEEELNNYQISITMERIEPARANELLNSAKKNEKAIINAAGDVFQFSLALIGSNGETLNLNQFKQPILLSLELNKGANTDLTGMYFISDIGELEYVGGTVIGDRIEAEVHHFSMYTPLEFKKTFTDVASGFWAEPAITLLASKHIVSGISNTEFAPKRSVTRAEFAAMVARALNLKATGGPAFDDVPAGAWFADSVVAAHEVGIIFGKTESKFDPNAEITRQEMTVILMRAYELMSGTAPIAGEPSEFADNDQISEWARKAIDAAFELELVNGKGNNRFEPNGVLTRAESAQAIANLLVATYN